MARFKRQIGDRIRKLRGERSQDWLAEASGVSRNIVSGIETGQRNPELDTLLRLFAVLGAKPGDVEPANGKDRLLIQLEEIWASGAEGATYIKTAIEGAHARFAKKKLKS